MKLIYNGVDLAGLATHVRVLQQTSVREPAEAPQRERVTFRVRLDFLEKTFKDNYALLQQAKGALRTQQAQLVWQNDDATYVNRTVTAAEDDSPEDVNARGGTYWQALNITFWYYNHDLVTNCLHATLGDLDLGAVEKWEERLNVQRYDDLRSTRKLVQGQVSASGHWQADTTQALDDRRKTLLALKDQVEVLVQAEAEVKLSYGSFTRVVRITDFRAEVDQPNNLIGWSISVSYTVYPNEQSYFLCEFQVSLRENKAEGILRLGVSGRVGAPTESAARAKLALLKGSLVPAGFAMLDEESEARSVSSQSDDDGDGETFIELHFQIQYRDASSIKTTFQRDKANAPVTDLGTVDKMSDRYLTTLFDEMKNQRRRTAGTVSMAGKWYVSEALSDADKQEALVAKKASLDTELSQGVVGTLAYLPTGTDPVFQKVVRVLDFQADVNRLRNCIEWSLSASFTRFPNEADYALCEFKLATRENDVEGTVVLSLSGKIGAPTGAAAREKLGRLRTQLIPVGYVRISGEPVDNQVEVESGRNSPGGNQGDGPAYIELSFSEDWQKTLGDVLTYRLRISETDDARTALIRSVYSGMVQASGLTITDAYTTAATQAAALGDGKWPMKLRSSLTENIALFQTSSGKVIVTVDFEYEYQRKGTMIFMEVSGELTADTFGQDVETVNGTIVAPTLAVAEAAYAATVRPLYADELILNERTTTQSYQRLADGANQELAKLEDRFTFSFQVYRPKTETSMAYTLEPVSNLQTLEKVTVVRGVIRAATQPVANAFLDSFLSGLGLGKKVRDARPAEYLQAPSATVVFTGLNFQVEFVDLLTGVNGILECEVTEEVQYTGDRLVVKPIPSGNAIVQRCGVEAGTRTVTARATATTETAARSWVKKQRGLLTPSPDKYEIAPRLSTTFRFLPQTDGTARGTGANVRLYECNGVYREILTDYAFS